MVTTAMFGTLSLIDGELWTGLAFLAVPALLLLARIPFAAWAGNAARTLDTAWEEAEDARRDGRLEEAVESLDRCAQHVRVPRSHAQSLLELGICQARLGRFEEATQVFGGLENHGGARLMRLGSLGAGWAALCMALGERNECADEWVEIARARKGMEDEFWLIPRAVLLSRAGNHTAAFEVLAACWWRMGQNLTDRSMRLARLVMAFAASHLEEPAYPPELILQGLLPASPLEYDFLGRNWPEMAEFLQAHGLKIAREDVVAAQRAQLRVVH